MNRKSRLQSARAWLAQFRGTHIAQAYSRWFDVDRLCAIIELRSLGVQLDPAYVRAVQQTLSEPSCRKRKRRKEQLDPKEQLNPLGTYGVDYDDNFSFIAGYTEGGVPFGLTWDEWLP
jgi:hypothetical protein